MKYGLVLEGGAMRGLFTAGVIDVLMENEISFDAVAGVSAGACFGCNYKSGQIRRAIRYNTRFCRDKRYCSTLSLIKTGDMFGAEFCYHTIPEKLDIFDKEAFDSSPVDFWVVCTDADTGKPVYHNCLTGDENDLTWMRASASMPLASKVVEVDGYRLLDGGVSDSSPLRKARELGFDKCVVVLTQPMGYVKQKNKALPVMRRVLRKYPKLLDAMARRQDVYNETVAYIRSEERAGRVFVIRPDAALEIGKIEHDPEKIQTAYDQGRAVGEKRLPALLEFLQN